MTEVKYAASLFNIKPAFWGLRGDPYLWEEMQARTGNTPMPVSTIDIEALIYKLFKECTGVELEKGKHIFIKKYKNGGMSEALVSTSFWIDNAIPLLIDNFIKNQL